MTKNKLSHHDRFTRTMMNNPKVAEEFFQENLPQHIKNAIDFSSIKLQKDSFIDDSLKLQIADLLYAVKFNGQPGFLYLLMEHASTPDPLLPFRMLKYIVAIMENHLKTTKGSQLPLVYPLILYTGKKPYKHSMDLFDLFPSQEREFAKEIFTSPYHLVDLTQVSDEELKKYLWFGTAALILKHIHDEELLPFFNDIIQILKEIEKHGEDSYIYSIVTYIAYAGKTSNQEDLVKTIKKLESVNEEKLMTIVEYLKPEVFKRGVEKGREEGREEGKHERDVEIVKAMHLNGIDLDKISGVTGYSKEEIKNILKMN